MVALRWPVLQATTELLLKSIYARRGDPRIRSSINVPRCQRAASTFLLGLRIATTR